MNYLEGTKLNQRRDETQAWQTKLELMKSIFQEEARSRGESTLDTIINEKKALLL